MQERDLTAVFERQQRIGYRSELILGEAEVDAHMKALFPDWRAQGRHGLPARAPGRLRLQRRVGDGPRATSAVEEGVAILSDVEVTGFELGDDDTVTAVETSKGTIEVGEQVVIAPGPWAKHVLGRCSACPMTIDIHTPSGDVARDQPMWTYWNLQEGEITVDPLMFDTADGARRR